MLFRSEWNVQCTKLEAKTHSKPGSRGRTWALHGRRKRSDLDSQRCWHAHARRGREKGDIRSNKAKEEMFLAKEEVWAHEKAEDACVVHWLGAKRRIYMGFEKRNCFFLGACLILRKREA